MCHLASSFQLIPPNTIACLCCDFNIPAINWSSATPLFADKLAIEFCDAIHDTDKLYHETLPSSTIKAANKAVLAASKQPKALRSDDA